MEGGLLTTPEFKAFTGKVVPYLNITTHIEGRAHEGLLREVGGRGFPTMKFMDGDGNVLGEPGGRDIAAFEKALASIESVFDLEKRIEAGEKGLEVKLFLAKMDMGAYKFEAAKKKAASFEKLTDEEKKAIAAKMVNLEVDHIMESAMTSEEGIKEAAVRFMEMVKEGNIPTGETAGMFWSVIAMKAEEDKNIEMFEKALNALLKQYGEEEGAAEYFDSMQEKLDKMKAEKAEQAS